jgi:solute carrier family 13 (sodium-dependent dicarboxylate transporter), member 2/3/5
LAAVAGLLSVFVHIYVVSWKKCLEEYPWNPIMGFGAAFPLGVALLDTGAAHGSH